jgi:hypothetical protein
MLSDPLAHQEESNRCGADTLLFSPEKALPKLPRLDLPCRRWRLKPRTTVFITRGAHSEFAFSRGRFGEDGKAYVVVAARAGEGLYCASSARRRSGASS